MSRASLTFKIPEEQSEFRVAMDGVLWKAVVWDLDNFLRGKVKHEDLTEVENKLYTEVREFLNDAVSQYELQW